MSHRKLSHLVSVSEDRWREARDWLNAQGMKTYLDQEESIDRLYAIIPCGTGDQRTFVFYSDNNVAYFKLAFMQC